MATVLVVDDSPVDRRLAGGLIEELAGIEVAYAENGEDALNRMREVSPDLIVTDMQMPEMDGLELVTRIGMQYPDVPVILMTAKGSEEIAVQALDQGASSYVPKSQLHASLPATVEDLLAMTIANKTYAELLRCQRRVELEYSLDNNPELVDAFVDLIQQMIQGMAFTDHTGKFRIGIALREALLNALFRGNLEIGFGELQQSSEQLITGGGENLLEQRRRQPPYCDRKIHVTVKIDQQRAEFVISDGGSGFAHADLKLDPSLLAADGSKMGRGLVLIHSFCDEVVFNDAGNQIKLVKFRDER